MIFKNNNNLCNKSRKERKAEEELGERAEFERCKRDREAEICWERREQVIGQQVVESTTLT